MNQPTSPHPISERSLGDIVAGDARAAAVLHRFGLDFCCGGERTLTEAATERHVPVDAVMDALAALGAPAPADRAERRWPDLDALTRHIVEHHHRYVRAVGPAIGAWLDKLVSRHGRRHPELLQVRETFKELADDLTGHMAKEENLLFPFIDELAAARRAGMRLPAGPFGTVLHPIRAMEEEHRRAGELVARLRALTAGFAPPDDACATYRVCFAEIERFEADLKIHVHLENHVLFPEAMDLEQRLT